MEEDLTLLSPYIILVEVLVTDIGAKREVPQTRQRCEQSILGRAECKTEYPI